MLARPAYDKSTHEYCGKCQTVKLHSEFPRGSKRNANCHSGLHYWCKACNNQATYVWEYQSLENYCTRLIAASRYRKYTQDEQTQPVQIPTLERATELYRRRLIKQGVPSNVIEQKLTETRSRAARKLNEAAQCL